MEDRGLKGSISEDSQNYRMTGSDSSSRMGRSIGDEISHCSSFALSCTIIMNKQVVENEWYVENISRGKI